MESAHSNLQALARSLFLYTRPTARYASLCELAKSKKRGKVIAKQEERCVVYEQVDFMATEYERMMDGTRTPTEKEITDFIGEPAKGAWVEVRRFLRENYDIVPEMIFDKKHGWDVRYRKSSKTLVTLTPEKDAVRVLIVLGKDESERALSMQNELSPKMHKLIEDTKQLHDGRWLWIRLYAAKDAEDLKKLLPIKRKPKKTLASA